MSSFLEALQQRIAAPETSAPAAKPADRRPRRARPRTVPLPR